tara:strand:+ start:6923 stop:7180 length:258 start_codon:yes stop_codon:yes gene_type:complete
MWKKILKNDNQRKKSTRLLSTVERVVDDIKEYDLSEKERKEADKIISQMSDMALKDDAGGFNKHLQEFNRFYARVILDGGKVRKR